MSLRLALFSLLLIALLKQKTARPLKKLTFETTKEMVSFSLSTRKMHPKKKIFKMEFENEKSAALSFSFKFYDR